MLEGGEILFDEFLETIVVERSGLSYHDAAPFETTAPSLGAALLTPTRIYVKPLLAALAAAPGAIKGLAHITGGGLVENVPRVLPKHLSAVVDVASWTLPPVFRWLKKAGGVTGMEMGRAFNNGIGMIIVVGKGDLEHVKGLLEEKGEKVFVVGELAARGEDEGCVLQNLESWE
ncbi:hypothetical protein ACJ72_06939 [Emergomyces africanus]|uniref:phosphoribosylformylglycinamidine cyclo-ligase n=1 Tax=Emergomyces africanus TaxID=1955775 RepID=A0A1B7NPK2_9EURO|nr:hypothetical protein ACJ72_06939 [Emergomyces africanus]